MRVTADERAVLEVLWRLQGAGVDEAAALLPQSDGWTRTAVHVVLEQLVRSGIVGRSDASSGPYRALIGPEDLSPAHPKARGWLHPRRRTGAELADLRAMINAMDDPAPASR